MRHPFCGMIGLVLFLTVTVGEGVEAQQPQRQYRGSPRTLEEQAVETSPAAPERAQKREHRRGMMGDCGTLQGKQDGEDQFSRQGMRSHRRQRSRGAMIDRGGMMLRHLERFTQRFTLTDEQRAQVRTVLATHDKDVIRIKADRAVMAIDIRQLLDADSVDLPKVKDLLQSMAGREADLCFAHIATMQAIQKLLTPEQQKQFRAVWSHLIDYHSMRGRGRRVQ